MHMKQSDPKTIRVMCPECSEMTAFATIPQAARVTDQSDADGKVRSVCQQCDTEFVVYFEDD